MSAKPEVHSYVHSGVSTYTNINGEVHSSRQQVEIKDGKGTVTAEKDGKTYERKLKKTEVQKIAKQHFIPNLFVDLCKEKNCLMSGKKTAKTRGGRRETRGGRRETRGGRRRVQRRRRHQTRYAL